MNYLVLCYFPVKITSLKDAFIGQIDRFCYLVEQIFATRIFPDSWKLANITPLQKDGNVHSVNNLRPISILPMPSKIIEKIIHNRMIHHLEIKGELWHQYPWSGNKEHLFLRSSVKTV